MLCHIRITLFILIIAACASTGSGPLLWSGLEAGRFPIGFKSWLLRAQASEFKHGAQHFVQISMWYPALPGTGTPMTFRDYLLLKLTENTYDEPTDAAREATIADFTRSLTSKGVSQRTADAIINSSVAARRDANTPLVQRSPLVYIAQGNGQSVADQAILAEFIASHGYVVVTSPSVMRLTGPLTTEHQIGARAEEQADDIDRAASAIGDNPIAVNIPVSVIGYDFGFDAAVLYVMHQPTNALVGIDGTIDSASSLASLKSAPMFDANAKVPPILYIYGETAPDLTFLHSMKASSIDVQKITSLQHLHFTTLGFAAAAFPEIAKATGAGSNIKRDVVTTAQKTLEFLDRIWDPIRPGS